MNKDLYLIIFIVAVILLVFIPVSYVATINYFRKKDKQKEIKINKELQREIDAHQESKKEEIIEEHQEEVVKQAVEVASSEEIKEESKEEVTEVKEETKEIKEEVKNDVKEIKPNKKVVYDKKDRLVLFFNNIGTPSLKLSRYEKGLLKEEVNLNVSTFSIVNGVFANIDAVTDLIKANVSKLGTLDILLSVDECFRSVISLPKMSKSKAIKLYQKEIKNDFPDFKDKYVTFEHLYEHKLGSVYYTYFVPLAIINYFKKVAKILGVSINSYNLWGNYLFDNIKNDIKEDFALIYVQNNLCTLMNSFNGKLVTFYSFECNDETDIISQYLSIIAKHEFELEKRKITNYIYASDKEYDLSSITNGLTRLDYNIDFSHYRLKGIKL
ncbi:MAG: hypothetical protein SO253_06425 [Bacilli bacterium]|nr:hypothetical protein [Bacilli bacterium]